MSVEKAKNNLRSLEQLKREKGKTHWAKLIAEERSSSRKTHPTEKLRG